MTLIRITIVLLAVCAALLPDAASAQLEVVRARHSSDVRAIEADGDRLWIGTGGGLFVYDLGDGEFVDEVVVGPRLPSSSVRAITATRSGVMVGTDRGLSVFDKRGVSVHTPRDPGPWSGLPLNDIRSIDIGTDGGVYFGTFGGGVGIVDSQGRYTYTREDSLLDNKVHNVVVEGFTRYFATSMGLCALRDTTWINYQAGAGIPRGEVRQMLRAGNRLYYLRVKGRGVFRFNGQSAYRILNTGVFPQDDVAAIALDSRGVLWAAGRYGGIAAYQGGNWTRVNESDQAIASEPWRCVGTDDDGGVFFGSAKGLVLVLRGDTMRRVTIPSDLPSGFVRSFAADSTGRVHMLCGPHVYRVDGGGALVDDRAPDGIEQLASSPRGVVWGAGRWGLFRRGGSGYDEVSIGPGERAPSLVSLAFDAGGSLWTATRDGAVYRYDGQLWLRVAEPGELFDGPIDRLRSAGGMWALSDSGDVALYDGGTWMTSSPAAFDGEPVRDVFTARNGAPVLLTTTRMWGFDADSTRWEPVAIDSVVAGAVLTGGDAPFVAPPSWELRRAFLSAADGTLILGTESGLVAARPGELKWVGPEDGLGGVAVADIHPGARGGVWVGFRADGLARIMRESLW